MDAKVVNEKDGMNRELNDLNGVFVKAALFDLKMFTFAFLGIGSSQKPLFFAIISYSYK